MTKLEISSFNPGFFKTDLEFNNFSKANFFIEQLTELAPKLDSLRWKRIWLGEHYGIEVAWRNPEILIAILAGLTEQIRIGPAGVLLNLRNPFHIAYDYKLLNYLYEDRIDLGLARGFVNEDVCEELGIDRWDVDKYDSTIARLIDLFSSDIPENNPNLSIPPYNVTTPDMWMLGTGELSMELAVKHRTNFCLSLFHKQSDLKSSMKIISDFKRKFEDRWNRKANYTVCVAGVCHENERKSHKMSRDFGHHFFASLVVGNPRQCNEKIHELQFQFGLSEIVFMDQCYLTQDKINCYELLTEALVI